MDQPTNDLPRREVRHWPDGTEVSAETEAAIDRIIATVRRAQAKLLES
ncbi:hypothetical protein [Microtetraspora malaysiensis]